VPADAAAGPFLAAMIRQVRKAGYTVTKGDGSAIMRSREEPFRVSQMYSPYDPVNDPGFRADIERRIHHDLGRAVIPSRTTIEMRERLDLDAIEFIGTFR
jgi:hypothetical protein